MMRPSLFVALCCVSVLGCKAGDTEVPEGDPASGIAQVAAGHRFSLVLLADGHVRMVGNPFQYDDVRVWPVDFGGPVVQVAAGRGHGCALLESGAVRCFGATRSGALGYGSREPVFDPRPAGDVDVGGRVVSIAAGHAATCAVLEGGGLRCWGEGQGGRLGYGNDDDLGDDETPAKVPVVPVGAPVASVAVGLMGIACAVTSSSTVRCWGQNVQGGLGYGFDGALEPMAPAGARGDIPLGAPVAQVVVGAAHVCARLEDGGVRCWGFGANGRLGYGGAVQTGVLPAIDVELGGPAGALSVGNSHTCAVLEGGALRCWGNGYGGRLGYGTADDVGDDETPSAVGDVDLGRPVLQVAAGSDHTCAVLEGNELRCWGIGFGGSKASEAAAIDLGDLTLEPLADAVQSMGV